MEFEEMQVIWNEQNNEKLYAINEEGLHSYIKKKSRSLNKWLGFVDWMMMFVNVGVGLMLIFDVVRDGDSRWELVLPMMYLLYGVAAAVLRLRRKQKQVTFEPTILGEVDKALWQINYLIKQGYLMITWYLVPLALVATLFFVWQGDYGWAIFMMGMPIFAYVGVRWENRKWHACKKAELEGIREKLLA